MRQTKKGSSEDLKASSKTGSTVSTNKMVSKKKKGKLAGIVNLPLDILYEIAASMHPLALLHLSRVSKAFCRLILSPTAKSIWKRVRNNTPGLPESFPEMEEPTFMSLLFDNFCKFCLKVTSKNVFWELRARMCGTCLKTLTSTLHKQELIDLRNKQHHSIYWMIPSSCQSALDSRTYYLNSEMENTQQQYDSQTNKIARDRFFRDARERVEQISLIAGDIREWSIQSNQVRRVSRTDIVKTRQNEIMSRLHTVGWTNEDLPMDRNAYDCLLYHPLVNKAQPLTERIWKNIQGPLIQFLEEKKASRLKKLDIDGHSLVVMKYLGQYRRSHLDQMDQIPPLDNFCRLKPLLDLIHRSGPVTSSDLEVVSAIMPSLCEEWLKSVCNLLLKSLKIGDSTPAEEKAEVCDRADFPGEKALLQHATVVWKCCPLDRFCPTSDVDSNLCRINIGNGGLCLDAGIGHHITPYPLFYPGCIYHFCCLRQHVERQVFSRPNGQENRQFKLNVEDSLVETWRSSFRPEGLQLDHDASLVVTKMIQVAEMDVESTTTDDMDNLSFKFGCIYCCQKNPSTRQVRIWVSGWREMIRHYKARHWGEKAQKPNIMKIMPEEYTSGTVIDEKVSEPAEWICVHCLDTPNETIPLSIARIKEHFISIHQFDATSSPVEGTDRIRYPGAPLQTGMTSTERDTQQILQFSEERLRI